jgi:hypothetical protein
MSTNLSRATLADQPSLAAVRTTRSPTPEDATLQVSLRRIPTWLQPACSPPMKSDSGARAEFHSAIGDPADWFRRSVFVFGADSRPPNFIVATASVRSRSLSRCGTESRDQAGPSSFRPVGSWPLCPGFVRGRCAVVRADRWRTRIRAQAGEEPEAGRSDHATGRRRPPTRRCHRERVMT